MKKRDFLLLAILLSICMSCKKEDIGDDPTPRVIRTFILDKTTGKNLIGKNGEPYHPDSIKLIALRNPDFYSILEPVRTDLDSGYYVQTIAHFGDIDFLLYLNKNDKDTMKFKSEPIINPYISELCNTWPPFKIYYQTQLVLDIKTCGDPKNPSSINNLTLILKK